MTDAELNALFCEKVCGWRRPRIAHPLIEWISADEQHAYPIGTAPDFVNDANAVLPWLEKHGRINISKFNNGWGIALWLDGKGWAGERASTFARVAVLALVKAAGVEVPS